MKYQRTSFIVLSLLLAMLLMVPLMVVGQPDGNLHPNVAALALGSGYTPFCTGVLVSPTVLATAGNCFASNTTIGVSFNSNGTNAASYVTGTYIVNPANTDFGVVVLNSPVIGITPAQLPSVNSLNNLTRDSQLTSVTYMAMQGATRNYQREFELYDFAGANNTVLRLRTSSGGDFCAGSGAPHFVGNTNVVGGISTKRGEICRNSNTPARLDTQSAYNFFSQYVSY